MSTFDTGIRPYIDNYLDAKADERRDYGEYWSASSAGYCMRKNIFERIQLPYVTRDARKQRVFTVGHIFHEWMQQITKDAGISVAQEVEIVDDTLMVKGHFDDLVYVNNSLILYDYKTQNSRAFTWQKDKPINYYHKMQLGTYTKMLRDMKKLDVGISKSPIDVSGLGEARILKISKDDLRMDENVLLWDDVLDSRVTTYWREQNDAWKKFVSDGILPACTCADHENGFMANEKYNPFFYNGLPCSKEWFRMNKNAAKLPIKT